MTGGRPLLLCIGDIDIDIVVKVPRPPGRDQKVDGKRVAQSAGGMAANVAVGASRLGTSTRMLGAVGDDAMGREALDALTHEGLDLSHVATRHGAATFFCIIMVDDEGEKSLVKAVSPAYLPRPADLTPAAFAGVDHVHLTFTEHELAAEAIARAKSVGASVSLDLEAADVPADGHRVAELVAGVDLLFVSEQSRSDIERRIGPLVVNKGKTVVMTRGRLGARLEDGDRVLDVAGHAVPVTDTSGAGDAFAAGFLHARLSGADDTAALHFANAAAAISTRNYGAQAGLPVLQEVEDFLKYRTPERSDA
ncbi:carbohydrate kinase family protein [Tranquillimonas alkanivorans]|uniref:Ribokinase n=1 Tax=Tranquillimonas alkanivorans TaxID=441119 RepID=A0A1I5V901_9RHOB|nr:carbohydrate kinase family protein [Tranquillimonas alkanivorans]SFQ03837.1 ribokinase [Tranquillimonas alkanivorans]